MGIERAKHTTVVIKIVEYDPDAAKQTLADGRTRSDETNFTVRADTTNQAIDKALRRLGAFKDPE